MKRILKLSNQQLLSLLELLGYEPQLEEEVQYKCGPDHSCEPFISYTVHIKLPEKNPVLPAVFFTSPKYPFLIH